MKRIVFLLVLGAILGSCNDMGDSVKDYVTDETVYPGKFDFAIGKTGYENVEIDLLRAGRIPASKIHLGKAKKTVVEYGADKPLVLDSVCSWVKVTGLTQRTTYKFSIYTMDEYGNKSVPVEVFQSPYTAAEKDALAIPVPVIDRGVTSATVQWRQNITSVSLTYLGLTYSYTDKDGTPTEGALGATPAQPSFTVENIPATGVTLNMRYRVIPKVNNTQIIDTLWLERPLLIPAQ
ncbi:hypothetical protein FACS189464_1000 [Bacteroidia bacterium]|nr:hypothetical protein FACS189464_1000 [Bacteroidia bacterium]